MLRGPGGNTSSGLSEVLLDKWCGGPRVPPELLFQLLSSPLTHTESSWRQSYMAAGTSQASSGQNESVTCWQCARFSESAGIIWMSSCADVWAIDRVVMWEMKEKVLSRLHFNEKPLMSFLFFLSSLLRTSRMSKGSQTLFGSLHECNLERYSISQRLRKKMCGEIVFERSRGASGWLGPEARRSCWSETLTRECVLLIPQTSGECDRCRCYHQQCLFMQQWL